MRIIKSFKVFEEFVNKPIKKFPTDKAIHWNISDIFYHPLYLFPFLIFSIPHIGLKFV